MISWFHPNLFFSNGSTCTNYSPGFHYIQHLENHPPRTHTTQRWDLPAYYKISAHYKFALRKLFDELGYERVIILEDDMELSPDFFSYFEEAGKVMDADPSVYTVSSWNDNGQQMHVADEKRLYRSDFFPGLGWMLHKVGLYKLNAVVTLSLKAPGFNP